MFRAVAYFLNQEQLADKPLSTCLNTLEFTLQGQGDASVLLCNGRHLGNEIRSENMGALASKLATRAEVRDFLRQAQQKIGAACSLVAEGRDTGTVIFPFADCKFFLDARQEVRAIRRRKQLLEQNGGKESLVPALELIEEQIRQRDDQDRNRALAPLRPAEDAIIVDTSRLGLAEVLTSLLDAARTKLCL
jgi:cytidylate kinase